MSKYKPEFPLTAKFDDGDTYEFDDISEVACTLEFCETRDENDCTISDNRGRPVIVVVEWLELKFFELE